MPGDNAPGSKRINDPEKAHAMAKSTNSYKGVMETLRPNVGGKEGEELLKELAGEMAGMRYEEENLSKKSDEELEVILSLIQKEQRIRSAGKKV